MNVVFTNLIKDPKCQRLLPLLGEIESSVLEPPLEGEHMDVRGPVVAGDDDDVTLLMETKQQGQLVNVSNGCQGVGHRNQPWKIIVCLLLITIKLKITKDNLGKKTTSIKNYVILLLLLPLKETNAKRKATAVRTTTMSLSILRNNGDNIISNFLVSFLLMQNF